MHNPHTSKSDKFGEGNRIHGYFQLDNTSCCIIFDSSLFMFKIRIPTIKDRAKKYSLEGPNMKKQKNKIAGQVNRSIKFTRNIRSFLKIFGGPCPSLALAFPVIPMPCPCCTHMICSTRP